MKTETASTPIFIGHTFFILRVERQMPPVYDLNMIIEDGKLNKEQREKLLRWINLKAPLIGKCPLCGNRNWSLLDHFVDLPIFRGGNMIIGGGPHYPNVGIICGNCGNTQLINAVVSGIFIADSPEPENQTRASDDGRP